MLYHIRPLEANRESTMENRRASGILLHPTSLPGTGIGELGSAAYRFVDWLASARQRRWQIMPLGPTGYGDSPYTSLSALAGNPLLVSTERLIGDGLLPADELAQAPAFPNEYVDFGAVAEWKSGLLQRAFDTWQAQGTPQQRSAFDEFIGAEQRWLDDFALFMALKEAFGGAAWNQWDPAIVRREPAALVEWRTKLAERVRYHQFVQWQFFSHWRDLKRYANERGVKLIGDIPIFVAYDGADVWANREIFFLDEAGNPTVVAGVPPDYFSAEGQLWGNPLYRWDVLAKRDYDWWIERFRGTFELVDIVRLDHFRGFEAYWEVPAGDETAINGRWRLGPGSPFFDRLREAFGHLPIVAEDLGLITPEVIALRRKHDLPGMAVLQFAWDGDPHNLYLPHSHERNQVIYTGTHDNDTTVGWWATLDDRSRQQAQRYLGIHGNDIAWDLIRVALMSVGDTAIVPMQDVLSLGGKARMNQPGRPLGNWGWRLRPEQLSDDVAARLRDLTELYGRAG